MELETRTIFRDVSPFEVREDGGDLYIEGYFARFDDLYDMGWGVTESIDRHAFDSSVSGDVRVLDNHDMRLVLGRTKAGTAVLRVDNTGLWARSKINREDTDAMNSYARAKRGDISGASFGFEIKRIEREYNESKGTIHRTLMDVTLYEVSICTFPAYEKTAVGARDRLKNAAEAEVRLWREKQKERFTRWH